MSSEKVCVDSYYIDIYEDLKRLDGTESYYSKMFNGSHRKVNLGDSLYIRTFTELKKRMMKAMKDAVGDIERYTVDVSFVVEENPMYDLKRNEEALKRLDLI